MIEVSVGIPAYNEEVNIKNLLLSVLSQREVGFKLKEIIVISDGSSDKTVERAKELKDPRLKLVSNIDRKGKNVRLNQIFKMYSGSFLIQLDADVQLNDENVFAEVVDCLVKGGGDLICIDHVPLNPRTYVERVVYFGTIVWRRALDHLGSKALIHYCSGRGRGFSREFTTRFVLPPDVTAEDIYSYIFAKLHGYKVTFCPRAVLKYRLPTSFKDYIKQMKRFLAVEADISRHIDIKILKEEYFFPYSVKLRALFQEFFKHSPHIFVGYTVLQLWTKLITKKDKAPDIFFHVESTKKL